MPILPPFDAADDDAPVGQVFNRRQALGLFGAPVLVWLAACDRAAATDTGPAGSGTCVARPALTEGPYYVDENLNRADIRADSVTGAVRPGTLLTLTFNVSRLSNNACTVLPGALVDVWHADAGGNYSDVQGYVGQDFLRGSQATDANGGATFTTVFPGWYSGRAVHIHFKVRSAASATQTYEFTSQLFFQDATINAVYAAAPYATRGTPNVRNVNDGIYGQSGGQTLVALTPSGSGYAGTFNLALNL